MHNENNLLIEGVIFAFLEVSMKSKHNQGEKLQEGLNNWSKGRSSADITNNLNNLSLLNHKRLLSSQKEARKKARQFESSSMPSTTPLTPAQQQQESLRFMDFYVQNIVDKYPKDPTVLRLAKEYKETALTQKARAEGLTKFENKVQQHLESIAPLNAGLELADATSTFCNQVALLTKNKELAKFATGLSAVSQAVKGVRKGAQAIEMLSLATTSGAVMDSGTMALGAAGAVLGAGMMLYSLCSEPESESNGLGEALAAIHQSIMEMWQDTRRNFEVTWEKIDKLDAKITEMARQNRQYYLSIVELIDYYGEMTKEKLSQIRATIGYTRQRIESLLHLLINQEAIKTVNTIALEGKANTVQNITERSQALFFWLTSVATHTAHSGQINRSYGRLEITSTDLFEALKIAMRPESIQALSLPMGLFASLAQDIDPSIISPKKLAEVIHTQDWNTMLACYHKVLTWAKPQIATFAIDRQEAYLNNLSIIKEKPLIIMDLLLKIQDSTLLWTKLAQDYLTEIHALQSKFEIILEKHRRRLNEAYKLNPELVVLKLEETASENLLRIQASRDIYQTLEIKDHIEWLQTLEANYDATYGRPKEVAGIIYSTKEESWVLQRCEKLGSISKKQAERLYQADPHFAAVVNEPYFVMAHAFGLINVDLSCFHQNLQPWPENQWDAYNTAHFIFSFQVKDKREPFTQINLFVDNFYPGGLQSFHRRQGTSYGNQHCMQVSQKNTMSQTMKDALVLDLDKEVLKGYRRSAAREILKYLDTQPFETARLKLLSFVKLFKPNSNLYLTAGSEKIKTLLNNIATTGSMRSLQTLVTSSLGSSLLLREVCDFEMVDVAISASILGKEVQRKIRETALHDHPLWQSMAHAYASIEMLEQKLRHAILEHSQSQYDDIDRLVYEAMPTLSTADQQFSDALNRMQTLISNADALVETNYLSNTALAGVEEKINHIKTQFTYAIDERIELNESLEADYTAPTVTVSPKKPKISLSREEKALLSQKWINHAQSSVNFSLVETIPLIENTIQQFNTLPEMNTTSSSAALIFVGQTQIGKSTLVNAHTGVSYETAEDQFGLPCTQPCPTSIVKEFTKTGNGQSSETLFPHIQLSQDKTYYLVDMPGYSDTRGKPQQMSSSIAFQCLPEHFTHIKGIVIGCNESALMEHGFVALRQTLENAGRLLPDFSTTAPNPIVFAITKSTGQRNPANVLKTFNALLTTEYNTAQTEDKLAVKRALLYLINDPSRILFVNPTNSTSIAVFNQKITTLTQLPIKQFNLKPSTTEMSLLQTVLDIIVTTSRRLSFDIQQLQTAMSVQIKRTLLSLPIDLPEELLALQSHLQALLAISKDDDFEYAFELIRLLNQQKDFSHEVQTIIDRLSYLFHASEEAKKAITAEELIKKHTELELNQPFFSRIIKINETLFGDSPAEDTELNTTGYETDSESEQQLKRDTDEYGRTHAFAVDASDSDEETQEQSVWVKKGSGKRALHNNYRSLAHDSGFFSFLREKGHVVVENDNVIQLKMKICNK